MSVGRFRNVISSEDPLEWSVFEEQNGVIRIKSDRDNLYLQLNGTNILLVQDARAAINLPSDPFPNLALQQWKPEENNEGFVLVNIGSPNISLALDRSNRVFGSKYTGLSDRGINFKTFVLEEPVI